MASQAATKTGGKPSRFVRFINDQINKIEKTQRQIANELGYDNSNIITMFKQGTTRVPIEKVPALALAIEVDAADLLRMWMEDYNPILLDVLNQHMGMSLSKTEQGWVKGLRKTFNKGLVPFDELSEDALKPLTKRAS